MITDRDLEQLLTATLERRADTITTGPSWHGAPAGRQVHRRPRMLLPLAAAAAVIAVVVAVVALLPRLTAGPTQPTHHNNSPSPSPSPSPSSSPSSSPSPSPSPTARTTCLATLPASWRTAVHSAAVALGVPNAQPLSVSTDGTLVALADAGPEPGTSRTVMLVPPHGAPTTAYTVADPDTYSVQNAQLSGHWLVVATTRDPRPPANTVPGSSPMPNVHELVVIDRRTGARTDVPIGSDYVEFAAVLDGRVYWAAKASYPATHATIRSYGLTSHDIRIEYSGPDESWVATAGGIGSFQSQRAVVTATLPSVVRDAVGPDTLSVASDGTAWAWLHGRTELGWWTPGQPRPTYLKLARAVPPGETAYLAVSGRFVFGDGLPLTDVRTAATARSSFGTTTSLTMAGGPVIGGSSDQRDGHYINGYWRDGTSQVLQLSSAGLPDLRC